jgi:hypothetical protein
VAADGLVLAPLDAELRDLNELRILVKPLR